MTLLLVTTCAGLVGVTIYLWEHVCVLERRMDSVRLYISSQTTLLNEYSTRLDILEAKQTQEILND